MRRVLALVLAVALLPLVLTGCGDKATDDGASSQEAAPSATSGSDPEPYTTDGELDVDAITRELDAIQQELDETALPDDSDFSDIESGL